MWGRFDLDYVRAERGEHTSAEWAGDAFGDLDYPDALEGRCGHSSQNLLFLDGVERYVLATFTLTPALSLRERGLVDRDLRFESLFCIPFPTKREGTLFAAFDDAVGEERLDL